MMKEPYHHEDHLNKYNQTIKLQNETRTEENYRINRQIHSCG